MPTLDHKNIGEVLETVYLAGIIKSVAPPDPDPLLTDLCSVEVGNNTYTGIPIYYHCSPTSVLKANGALTDAGTAFAEDDEVIVQAKRSSSGVLSELRVVGFVTGLQSCNTDIIRWMPKSGDTVQFRRLRQGFPIVTDSVDYVDKLFLSPLLMSPFTYKLVNDVPVKSIPLITYWRTDSWWWNTSLPAGYAPELDYRNIPADPGPPPVAAIVPKVASWNETSLYFQSMSSNIGITDNAAILASRVYVPGPPDYYYSIGTNVYIYETGTRGRKIGYTDLTGSHELITHPAESMESKRTTQYNALLENSGAYTISIISDSIYKYLFTGDTYIPFGEKQVAHDNTRDDITVHYEKTFYDYRYLFSAGPPAVYKWNMSFSYSYNSNGVTSSQLKVGNVIVEPEVVLTNITTDIVPYFTKSGLTDPYNAKVAERTIDSSYIGTQIRLEYIRGHGDTEFVAFYTKTIWTSVNKSKYDVWYKSNETVLTYWTVNCGKMKFVNYTTISNEGGSITEYWLAWRIDGGAVQKLKLCEYPSTTVYIAESIETDAAFILLAYFDNGGRTGKLIKILKTAQGNSLPGDLEQSPASADTYYSFDLSVRGYGA